VIAIACSILLIAPQHAAGAATRAEFAAQADPYCASANRDIDRLNKRFRALHRRDRHVAAGRVLEKTGPRLARSVRQVRGIVPPPGDEQLVDTWLDLVNRIARNNKRMGRAHARENFRLQDRLVAQNGAISVRARDLVFDWPFRACAG
jgi:hypothetical protein